MVISLSNKFFRNTHFVASKILVFGIVTTWRLFVFTWRRHSKVNPLPVIRIVFTLIPQRKIVNGVMNIVRKDFAGFHSVEAVNVWRSKIDILWFAWWFMAHHYTFIMSALQWIQRCENLFSITFQLDRSKKTHLILFAEIWIQLCVSVWIVQVVFIDMNQVSSHVCFKFGCHRRLASTASWRTILCRTSTKT